MVLDKIGRHRIGFESERPLASNLGRIRIPDHTTQAPVIKSLREKPEPIAPIRASLTERMQAAVASIRLS